MQGTRELINSNDTRIINGITGKRISINIRYFLTFEDLKSFITAKWGIPREQLLILLETEVENVAALNLYEGLGFIRMKRMFRYYLNEGDAFKLILPITEKSSVRSTFLMNQNPLTPPNNLGQIV